MEHDWKFVKDALPDEDVLVEATTPSGDVRELRLIRGYWFLPDRSMYVYFDVVKWRVAA